MNETFRRQYREVLHIMDNCSAHLIEYGDVLQDSILFISRYMNYDLRPVDSAIVSYFKAAFRRLLVIHLLENVKHVKNGEISGFILNRAVILHNGVRLLAAT